MSLAKYFDAMRPVSMVFDIGCDSFNFSTKELRAAFPEAVIHAFEPDPRHIASIKEAHKDELMRINFHPLALTDKCGVHKFWQSTSDDGGVKPDWAYSGSLKAPRRLDYTPGDFFHFKPTPLEVPCTTLDKFCEDSAITKIDLFCMDVQGGEDLVLKGATKILPHIRFIYAEHNAGSCYQDEPGLEGLKSLLPGWEVVECWPYDVLFKNKNLP